MTQTKVTPIQIYNPYKFSAYRNAAWTTSGAWPGTTVCGFDTELFDTNNNFDVTTNKGRYTAPVDGFYFFSAYGGTNLGGGSGFGINFIKNGSAVTGGPIAVQGATGSFAAFAAYSVILQLTAGDYVEVNIYASGTGGSTGVTANNFSGYLVSQT